MPQRQDLWSSRHRPEVILLRLDPLIRGAMSRARVSPKPEFRLHACVGIVRETGMPIGRGDLGV